MIPERLIDVHTSFAKQNKRHTVYTHLGCIFIRIILGLLIYYKIGIFKSYFFLMILFSTILIVFGYKLYITQNATWKVYIRTLLFYGLAVIITSLDSYVYKKKNKNISGLFIIIYAIMGLQSRHIQNNFIS